eukprot:gene20664-22049_t
MAKAYNLDDVIWGLRANTVGTIQYVKPAFHRSIQRNSDPALESALLDTVSLASLFSDDDTEAFFKFDDTMTQQQHKSGTSDSRSSTTITPAPAPTTTTSTPESPTVGSEPPSPELEGLAAAADAGFHESLFGEFTATAAPVEAKQQQQQQQQQYVQRSSLHRSPLVAAPVERVQELGPGPDQLTPRWDGVIPESFWDLEEEHIALISSRLTPKQINDAKRLRRRVKNRQSARVCSTRKRVKCHSTASTNAELHAQLKVLHRENESILNQHTLLQHQLIALQKQEAEAVREKVAMEAEVARMQKMLGDALAGMENDPLQGLSGSLFAIAA